MIWEVKHARFFPKDEDGFPGEPLHLLVARNVLNPQEIVSNSERGYHVFSDVGTKLEFVGFNEAVHVRVATDIFSRIGLTRCLSGPYIPSAGCDDLIS